VMLKVVLVGKGDAANVAELLAVFVGAEPPAVGEDTGVVVKDFLFHVDKLKKTVVFLGPDCWSFYPRPARRVLAAQRTSPGVGSGTETNWFHLR
jgi:hypothetical protein